MFAKVHSLMGCPSSEAKLAYMLIQPNLLIYGYIEEKEISLIVNKAMVQQIDSSSTHDFTPNMRQSNAP